MPNGSCHRLSFCADGDFKKRADFFKKWRIFFARRIGAKKLTFWKTKLHFAFGDRVVANTECHHVAGEFVLQTHKVIVNQQGNRVVNSQIAFSLQSLPLHARDIHCISYCQQRASNQPTFPEHFRLKDGNAVINRAMRWGELIEVFHYSPLPDCMAQAYILFRPHLEILRYVNC